MLFIVLPNVIDNKYIKKHVKKSLSNSEFY